MWCVLAIGLAFMWSEYRFRVVALPIPAFVFLIIPVISIAVAVIAMYRTSFISGPSDVAISTIPASGLSVVASQLLAIFLTWARLVIPFVFLLIAMDIRFFYGESDLRIDWLAHGVSFAGLNWIVQNLITPDLTRFIDDKLTLDFKDTGGQLSTYAAYLGICALPWTIALWWSAKLKSGRGPAIMFFFGGLIVFAVIMLALFWLATDLSGTHQASSQLTSSNQSYESGFAHLLWRTLADDYQGWHNGTVFVGWIALVVGLLTSLHAAIIRRRDR
jgi:hypothetical protein